MPGKVFISCGQRPPDERRIAQGVKDLLQNEFGLDSYLAFKIQSLDDIMTITNELRSCDYYLFIDFVRRPETSYDLPVSLFTHQELALAHHVGYQDIIALQQDSAPLEGFLRYMLSNPEHFIDESDLYSKLHSLVEARGWSSHFSRNLIVEGQGFSSPFQYADESGSFPVSVYHARVTNKRLDIAATGTICIFDYYIRMSDNQRFDSTDRSYLKWAGQRGYERTILPKDFGDIDLLSIHLTTPGLFLHSLKDAAREPVISDNDRYQLHFKLYSRGFSLVEFTVELDLRWVPLTAPTWINSSTARII